MKIKQVFLLTKTVRNEPVLYFYIPVDIYRHKYTDSCFVKISITGYTRILHTPKIKNLYLFCGKM